MEQLTITGNIGQDATIFDHNGKKQVRFSVAVNKNYKDSQGNKVERTEWITVFYSGTGLAPYLKKGTKVFVQGELTTRLYKDQQGQYQIGKTISGFNTVIELLDKKQDSTTPAPAAAQSAPAPAGAPDDDMPF